ncbi:uncharacterized protein BDZ99DRAFT_80758 [Mytilinidion resinicola]|uniref:Uncharacterized protein n=1 Tax=Mytilinidion resinicola TaxID=574789 RepID=A0A6A6YF89_9PEZI|nr:uncharacterized protein BDZ99DRAFT_80758 [Mytilinidion resinicola]KAF2807496.1 hypothetical protein BDZ99DRAFT_80758 [Mytilinidion resinicola]
MAPTKTSPRQNNRRSTLPLQKKRSSKRLEALHQAQQRKIASDDKHLGQDRNTNEHDGNYTDSQETITNSLCPTCTRLRAYMDSSIKANTVEYLGWRLPGPVPNNEEPHVWVDLGDKNQHGLLRWYPASSAFVLVASGNVLQGLELAGVVMCEHFEDVGAQLGKQLSDTASLMNLLASKR